MSKASALATETDFYRAVRLACDAALIDDVGRSYVEMTCLDNACDAPAALYWTRAIETLHFFVGGGDLLAVSRNER